MTATLHDLACDGSDCSCAVVYLVRETPSEGEGNSVEYRSRGEAANDIECSSRRGVPAHPGPAPLESSR
jgi:hypothetical protein